MGNYTQTWYVGNVAATPSLSFTVSVAAVVAHNLTHPDLAPNFLVGDTYQYNVYGPPNQPVYNVQNSGPLTQVGQTDNNGTYTTSGVEQTAWIGSYTQVWSVGNNQASPALSFLVGQINSGGTLTTTSVGQTSDGSVVGISSVSVANGVATTYSATEMQYNASLYYDAQTVGTLYEGGNQVQQGYDYHNGTAGGSLSYSATSWSDYSLQSDHYAVAYFLVGGYYENPFYYQDGSCTDGGGDCTYWPGGGAFYIAAATIYLGSTLTDQTAIPQDGSLTFGDNIDGVGSVLPGRTPPPGGWAYVVNKWKEALAAAWAITLAKQSQDNTAMLPFMLQVIGDCQTSNQTTPPPGVAERVRTYRILNGLGRPWPDSRRLIVRETMINWTAASNIGGGGNWGTSGTGADPPPIRFSTFEDTLTNQRPSDSTTSGSLQQFYAQDFEFSGFSYPGIPGYSKPTVPLLVIDAMSKTSKGIFGTLTLTVSTKTITINNDNGDAPNLIYPNSAAGLKPPPIACGDAKK